MSSQKLKSITKWAFPAMAVIVVVMAIVFRGIWWQPLSHWVAGTVQGQHSTNGEQTDSSDEQHQDGQPHDESVSLDLSEKAMLNLGLTNEYLKPLQLETFRKTISVPAIIQERPGRTRIKVSTPLTGIISHVHAVTGEAVLPGSLLFEIRLTHEDLVETQTEFVQTLGELDVEQRELKRLEGVASSGAVAGKVVLERQYARDKLTALLNAQKESLKLHGLSDEQIADLAKNRSLLKSLKIFAPSVDGHPEDEFKFSDRGVQKISYEEPEQVPLILETLHVLKGQSVVAGETLCEMVDYQELYIEGRAFERDARAVTESMQQQWTASAMFESQTGFEIVENLPFAYIANQVNADSRTLSFFVRLPNTIVRDESNSGDQRFITWRYRPGQRLQLLVPVEEWQDQFVLPVDAVTQEGAEYFVFQQNGDHFDRVPVHVKHKDQRSVVIANDGALFPGDVVARRGAHQMQMALKNKSGGGVDPHAGHSH